MSKRRRRKKEKSCINKQDWLEKEGNGSKNARNFVRDVNTRKICYSFCHRLEYGFLVSPYYLRSRILKRIVILHISKPRSIFLPYFYSHMLCPWEDILLLWYNDKRNHCCSMLFLTDYWNEKFVSDQTKDIYV